MTLLLDSLCIENYRVFKRLEIPRLGRVNLLVGRNNSGKSSVLEAVRLYVSRGLDQTLVSILKSHDDLRGDSASVEERLHAVKQLFHGRSDEWTEQSEIRIGPLGAVDQALTVRVMAVSPRVIRAGSGMHLPQLPALDGIDQDEGPQRPAVVSTFATAARILSFDTEWTPLHLFSWSRRRDMVRYHHVSPYGLSSTQAAGLWDSVALSDLEQEVTEALRIISPDIERISFVGDAATRVPLAKLTSQTQPIALRSLGDGVNRLMGIALSLASARGGVLLIDEVENGIHFTAQRRLWELIFRLADRLDTQVFATTHSWDCIEAFQKAAKSDENEEAALIRLDTQNGDISPVSFTERELAIVTREQIEVR